MLTTYDASVEVMNK